jgi:hypothetical protein
VAGLEGRHLLAGRFLMVKATWPPGGTSALDDMEMGCWPSPNGVRPVFSQANWPGSNENPLWSTGFSTSVRASPSSPLFSTTSHFLFQFKIGVRILYHKSRPINKMAYTSHTVLMATVVVYRPRMKTWTKAATTTKRANRPCTTYHTS